MNLDLSKIKKVYFLGIGGIGVSAIARMMKSEGKDVSGRDPSDSQVIEALRKEGIEIEIGPNSSTVPEGSELVVYTRALEVADAHILEEVKAQNIPILSYPQVLKIISENKFTIAISGMHGKTTTTSMCSHVFSGLKLDPTTIVGSIMKDTGSNYLHGDSQYFIVEADEYRRSFLNLSPKVLVITNIEEDHLDYYKDIADIKSAFRELAEKVPPTGAIICDPSNPYVRDVIEGLGAMIVDYTTYEDKVPALLVPGKYNRSNASCILAVVDFLRLPVHEAGVALQSFAGTWRRFEYIGKTESGALVYDDYAHHPSEINAVLGMVEEEFPTKKVFVVFHPHLYSRTKLLFRDFVNSLARKDVEVLLPPIYPAREEHDPTISSEMLAEEIVKLGGNARAYSSFEEIAQYLSQKLTSDDLLLTLGAGESNNLAYKLARPSKQDNF